MDDYPKAKPRKDSPREMRAVFVIFSLAWPIVVFVMGQMSAMSSKEAACCSADWQGVALLAVPYFTIVFAVARWFPWSGTAESNKQPSETPTQP